MGKRRAAPSAWYEIDGDILGMMPGQGLYRWNGEAWSWHAHGTNGWDFWHRQVGGGMYGRRVDGPPEGAPPLPPRSKPAKAGRDALGPWAESEALKAWVGGGRTAWVVLREDPYESQFGDGVFHDLVACVATEAEAEAVPLSGVRHVRRLQLSRAAGAVVAKAERSSSADRYRVADALGLLLGA